MGKFFSRKIIIRNIVFALLAVGLGFFTANAEYNKWRDTLDDGCRKMGREFINNKYGTIKIISAEGEERKKISSDANHAENACWYISDNIDEKGFDMTWAQHVIGLWALMAAFDYFYRESNL